MTAPHQRELPLRDPRYRRPVMTMSAAKGILDCSEDQIIAMIDEQLALYAFNIATQVGPEHRRELRILTASVAEYLKATQADAPCGRAPCYHTMMVPEDAIRLVLPPGDKPYFTGTQLQRSLNCGSDHILSLVQVGLQRPRPQLSNLKSQISTLQLVPGTNYQPGPGGSPCITRESFTQFLQARLAIPTFGKSEAQ